jgi:Uri superfamily endonuclease
MSRDSVSRGEFWSPCREEIETDDRGAYVLIITLSRARKIGVGGLGVRCFQPGTYFYVGSALSGFRSRLPRYFRTLRTPHWHIDRLLEYGRCAGALCCATAHRDAECRIAEALDSSLEAIAGFGCSDCRCRSHLFWRPLGARS